MSPKKESSSNKTELVRQLDELIAQIKSVEESAAIIMYKSLQDEAVELTNQLKDFVVKDGAFQTKYVAFQRVTKNIVDWKGVCEVLYKEKRIKDKDILPFKSERLEIRAMKIKQGDLEVES